MTKNNIYIFNEFYWLRFKWFQVRHASSDTVNRFPEVMCFSILGEILSWGIKLEFKPTSLVWGFMVLTTERHCLSGYRGDDANTHNESAENTGSIEIKAQLLHSFAWQRKTIPCMRFKTSNIFFSRLSPVYFKTWSPKFLQKPPH